MLIFLLLLESFDLLLLLATLAERLPELLLFVFELMLARRLVLVRLVYLVFLLLCELFETAGRPLLPTNSRSPFTRTVPISRAFRFLTCRSSLRFPDTRRRFFGLSIFDLEILLGLVRFMRLEVSLRSSLSPPVRAIFVFVLAARLPVLTAA